MHQPWATLIALGYKTIETRSRAPSIRCIGQPIAIHASKRKVQPEKDQWAHAIWRALADAKLTVFRGAHKPPLHKPPLGMVVATARLDSVMRVISQGFVAPDGTEFLDGKIRAFCSRLGNGAYTDWQFVDPYGDFSPGRYLWLLEDIEPVDPPIPATGRQWIWDWQDPRLEAQ